MTLNDMDFFLERAAAELAMAQGASCSEDARAHCLLARHYLDRVHREYELFGPLFG